MNPAKRFMDFKILYIALFITYLIAQLSANAQTYGAESNYKGNPIGGISGYNDIIARDSANYLVKDAEELLDALRKAEKNEIIYIDDLAEIDLTDRQKVLIPGGVTLASGRGNKGSLGALIYTNRVYETGNISVVDPILFRTNGEDIRITGLRLRGPDPSIGRFPYEYSLSVGIEIRNRTSIDNCQLYNWANAAIKLDGRYSTSYASVRYCYIHDCRRTGFGYGINLVEGDVYCLAEANVFDSCRHAIAAWGASGTEYEASYNLVGKYMTSHSFDVHGGMDRRDGTDIAGKRVRIHHNTFASNKTSAVVVRGTPEEGAWIYNNWFYIGLAKAVVFPPQASEMMHIHNNRYGISSPITI